MVTDTDSELEEARAAVLARMRASRHWSAYVVKVNDEAALRRFERAVRRDEAKEGFAEILRHCDPPFEVIAAVTRREHLRELEGQP